MFVAFLLPPILFPTLWGLESCLMGHMSCLRGPYILPYGPCVMSPHKAALKTNIMDLTSIFCVSLTRAFAADAQVKKVYVCDRNHVIIITVTISEINALVYFCLFSYSIELIHLISDGHNW